jgi:hypothetical protein
VDALIASGTLKDRGAQEIIRKHKRICAQEAGTMIAYGVSPNGKVSWRHAQT